MALVSVAVAVLAARMAPSTLACAVRVDAGSSAWSSSGPSVQLGLAVGAGALVVTGQTPDSAARLTFAVPSGALSITGYAPALQSRDTAYPVGSAGLVLNGLAPNTHIKRTDRIEGLLNVVRGRADSLRLTGGVAGDACTGGVTGVLSVTGGVTQVLTMIDIETTELER